MRIQRGQSNSKVAPLLKILVSLAVITAAAFSLAWVWHTTQKSVAAEGNPTVQAVSEVEVSPPEEPSVSQPEEPQSQPEEESSQEESVPAVRTQIDGAVPETAPVDNSYFDDALFLGDSISTGIPLYHIADNAAVVAMTGINTDNINYKEVIDAGDGTRVTVLEAARALDEAATPPIVRKKIYILLGGNGIGFDRPTFIEGYKTFVDSVKVQYPGAIIYLQSMTPVTTDYQNEFDPEMDNAKIDAYNLEIMALAKREGVYYLDVASALKDENGALPEDASPVDGMHFSPEYYAKWFDYLKTHAIPVEDKKI